MLTGLSIDNGQILKDNDGIEYQTYMVVKQSITGANKRITAFDYITIFLIPELRDMKFQPIHDMCDDAIKRLKIEKSTTETLTKIELLYAAKALIDKFVTEQQVVKKTKKFFIQLFRQTHPDDEFLFGTVAERFYEELVDMKKLEEFITENKGKNDCFSKCMTIETALEFWKNPDAISGRCDNRQADVLCTIIRFLMTAKNQSNVEREIANMKRNCHQNRSRLKSENWHNEAFLRQLRHQNQIFNDLKSKNQTEKRDKDIRKVY